MRTHRAALFATAALALTLPSLAAAQEEALEEGEVLEEEALAEGEPTVEAEIIPLAGWAYDELYTAGLSVEELLDADVNSPDGEDIGEVENVLFSEDGRILSIIAEVGGFLEIGDTHVNIPWEMVSDAEWDDGIEIPFEQEAIEEYTLFTEEIIGLEDVQEVQQVSGDNAGVALTGPRVWRATELIGDYARLREGEGFVNYGYVDDIIVRDGQVVAVVATPDVGWGMGGYYAYPYHRGAWDPGVGFYDLPYERDEIEALEPLDPDLIED